MIIIDCNFVFRQVIQGSWGDIPPLFDLERFLVEQGFCERSTLRVLDKATVPLIKFRDRKTDIAVDISLNQVSNGLVVCKFCSQKQLQRFFFFFCGGGGGL